MGHTHYWSFNSVPRGKASQGEKAYQNAIKKCAKVVRAYSKQFGGLSGYSAHSESYAGITFNGSERVGQCEPFILREHLNQNDSGNFCKTRQYPYDTVVVACLIILNHYLNNSKLGQVIEVASDGDASEWADGLTLAQKETGLKSLTIPASIRVIPRVG